MWIGLLSSVLVLLAIRYLVNLINKDPTSNSGSYEVKYGTSVKWSITLVASLPFCLVIVMLIKAWPLPNTNSILFAIAVCEAALLMMVAMLWGIFHRRCNANDEKIWGTNYFGKLTQFFWSDVSDVSFNVISGLLTIKAKDGKNIKISFMQTGAKEFVAFARQKLRDFPKRSAFDSFDRQRSKSGVN